MLLKTNPYMSTIYTLKNTSHADLVSIFHHSHAVTCRHTSVNDEELSGFKKPSPIPY